MLQLRSRFKAGFARLYKTSRRKQLGWSVASAAGTAAVLYAVLPTVWAIGILVVVIAHEGAHFVAARAHRLKASLPVFVPLIVFAMGITPIEKSSLRSRWLIYAAGPVTGTAVALGIALVAIWVPMLELGGVALALACAEGLSLVVGGDGRKMKRALEA